MCERGAGGWRLVALARQTAALPRQPRIVFRRLLHGEVRNSPRPLVIHTLLVDLRDPGVRLLVTPGDPAAERSLRARTTSAFLEEFDLQAAVNGDGFEPWVSNSIFRYYPHVGDPIDPIGLAASQGIQYAQGNGAEPTLFILRNNRARL